MKVKEIFKDMYWLGNLEPELRTFHYLMPSEFGTSYNSYLLKGSEKIAIFETSKDQYFNEFIENIKEIVKIKDIDYIIMDHVEPDCAGSVERLLEMNPEIKLVGSVSTLNYIQEICNRHLNTIPIKDGDILSLGNKTLRFFSIANQNYSRNQKRRWNNKITTITVPNFQWIDTTYIYIEEDNAIVTCDSFSTHYSCQGVTNDCIQNHEDYMKALRCYFDYTIAPYKSYILKAIDKIECLNIDVICPGHGPVITKEPRKVIEKYKEWSISDSQNTQKTVVIPYVSVYGYTRNIAEKIAEGISDSGDIDIKLFNMTDICEKDFKQVLDAIAIADGILFGTPTIKGEAPKHIWDLATSMFSGVHGGKIASAFGSYGWSGEGVSHIISRLYDLNMKVYGSGFCVRLKPNETQLFDAFEFGYGFGMSVLKGELIEPKEITKDSTEDFQRYETSERFLIIGNGAAGTTACEEIRKRNRNCDIELISKEHFIGYNRMMLCEGILAEIDNEKILLHPNNWYEENNITLTLGTKVTKINHDNKMLKLSDGETRIYDKLILATGSEAFVPYIKGIDKEGVFTVHSLKEVNTMRNYIDKAVKNVVIVGGGIMGLETAWEFRDSGLNITILEKTPILMDIQLDEKAAEFFRDSVEKSGIIVITSIEIDEILGDSNVTGIQLSDGRILDCDLVIISAGVVQNIELAKNIGIEVGHSIVVNERMETSIEDIYACGDCAEFKGINDTLWSQAVEMAKVAAINAVGGNAVYKHSESAISYNGMNINLFSIGDNGKNTLKKYITKEHCDKENYIYEKLYFTNGRFCGGILIGSVNRAGELLDAFYEKRLISKMHL